MVHKKSSVLPFFALALLALLFGLWAGLLRLGWALPGGQGPLPVDHGALMVSGFLGTLIALERVAAMKRRWMFLAPLFSGLGWVICLAFPSSIAGPLLIVLGSLAFTGILITMIRMEPRIFTVIMGLGAVCWLVGNLLWLAGQPVFQLVFWWMAFLVLTVAGERIELSRVLRPTRRQHMLFGIAAGIFTAGVLLSTWKLDEGTRLVGAGLLAMSAWLAFYDLARRNLRHPIALTRYIAACLFAGYVWLGISGVIMLIAGRQIGGGLYDAFLHTVFVGFIISMIFGHMPIIFPALTGMMMTFKPVFYVHLILLHVSLLLRVFGDLLGLFAARSWGGLLNEIAILVFIGVTAWALLRGNRAKRAIHAQ